MSEHTPTKNETQTLESRLNSLEEKMVSLWENSSRTLSLLEKLKEEVDYLDARFESMDSRIDFLSEKIDDYE